MTDELEPPPKTTELKDPGAHELAAFSESDEHEHFSDASEGRHEEPKHPSRSGDASPIPITRVERVDDEPAYGEVPGTDAYKMRTQDAVPDELEVVPDGQRSRSASQVSISDRPLTPGGTPIPKTVVERVDDGPCFGEVPGTDAYQKRLQDAVPDEVVKVPDAPNPGSPTASIHRYPLDPEPAGSEPEDSDAAAAEPLAAKENNVAEADDDGDFGDFDDFEEGGEGDDDFGDFDDGFQGEDEAETPFDKPPSQPSVPSPPPGPPVLNFEDLSTLEEVLSATNRYLEGIFPGVKDAGSFQSYNEDTRSIFAERSLSLWSQLVTPPPLQPPDWVRSRIRRLFLVSLGVPVDLDEILPASKQKKLILPSINILGERSPRPSADDRNSALGRVKQENASSASLDSSASKPERKRKGPPPPPQLDISSTSMLCSTTDAALQNFTDGELQAHVKRLQELQGRANEVFTYWQKRMESALGDKEAFESVIENLVAHAKKLR